METGIIDAHTSMCMDYGGVGLLYFNPKAELNGTWHALQPLQTEA
jgi:hypothetical protein